MKTNRPLRLQASVFKSQTLKRQTKQYLKREQTYDKLLSTGCICTIIKTEPTLKQASFFNSLTTYNLNQEQRRRRLSLSVLLTYLRKEMMSFFD